MDDTDTRDDEDKARVRRILIALAHDRVAAGKSTAADMAEGMLTAGAAVMSAHIGVAGAVAMLRKTADQLEATAMPPQALN